MISADYVIVGSGLTGAVIARRLVDAGREVQVLERRSYAGGNVHDHVHASGIRIHTHGPHYFRTNSDRIWAFATRFAPFYRYEAALLSLVDGRHENWPIAASLIRRHAGPGWRPEFVGAPRNFEESALSLMPRCVYEKFVKEYNEKQWGVPAHTLSVELCKRFDIRADDEPRLKPQCKHQGIPEVGYAEWMRRMLAGIPVTLDFDYLSRRHEVHARKLLVFTGPIDEFFDFDLGRLAYRGQRRSHRYLADVDFAQPCGQVNNPMHCNGAHIRTLEWKHMMQPAQTKKIRGTVLTTETPFTPTDPGDYEYPFPDRANADLAEAYRFRAGLLDSVLICGRLGEYRYYDMDQAIGRAMALADKILVRREYSHSSLATA
ncbi:MAG TPA: UDP-galactopyranose mutase [Gemmataceae bacterium]|nr:UDP-galactopyranose mutase [Gemmataceae bacterium]